MGALLVFVPIYTSVILCLANITKNRMLLEMRAGTIWDYVAADVYILRLTKGQNLIYGPNRRRRPWMIILLFFLKRMMTMCIVCTWLAVKIIGILCIATPIVAAGKYVALALSVARLVQGDYGDAGGDAANKAKLNAALIIFYVLAIFHSSYLIYRLFVSTFEPWMWVGKQYGFGDWGPKILWRYQYKTRVEYRKDGFLPNNWNLITFSVGLLESASPDDRLWGARVLDTFTRKAIPISMELLSSSQAIQNLIYMIGLTRTDNHESRERAARIVAGLASELRITQFPEILRCICCLFESCNQYNDSEDAHPSKNSEPTLDKTARKMSVETLEHSHHQEDAHLSLAIPEKTDHKQVMSLASGKVPNIKTLIQTLCVQLLHNWKIYYGVKYHYPYASKGTKELISQGLVILERLTQDEGNCIEIIRHQRLLSKITLPLSYQDLLNHGWEDHTWAEMLSRSLTVVSRLIRAGPGEDTTRLRHDMARNTVAVHNLMRILEVDNEGAFSEQHGLAIEILTELAYDDSFRKIAFDESTTMTEMLMKTLRRIFHEDSDNNGIVAKEEEEKDKRVRRKAGKALARLLLGVPSARDNSVALTSAPNVNDIYLLPKQDMVNLLTKETEEQSEDRKMLMSMLSLTMVICNKNVISADDFTRAIPDDAALVKKLKEIVEMLQDATTGGWRMLKLVCQVVIAVVQLKPSCTREFNEHNFKEALSKALAIMSGIDNCMIFAGNDREVPVKSLASLVKEAQELLAQEQGDIIST
ncbi:unnamed protein product [Triticum turgidum subsp. durum]|uniref:Uncharacterized protein n=1 Tax=Triticum turgidum subsp. durum TaxID=4567 RepID=A0A9R0WIK4_TRITD|nr:unnamed protein product [Triticum turgidum subsp. durum]